MLRFAFSVLALPAAATLEALNLWPSGPTGGWTGEPSSSPPIVWVHGTPRLYSEERQLSKAEFDGVPKREGRSLTEESCKVGEVWPCPATLTGVVGITSISGTDAAGKDISAGASVFGPFEAGHHLKKTIQPPV